MQQQSNVNNPKAVYSYTDVLRLTCIASHVHYLPHVPHSVSRCQQTLVLTSQSVALMLAR